MADGVGGRTYTALAVIKLLQAAQRICAFSSVPKNCVTTGRWLAQNSSEAESLPEGSLWLHRAIPPICRAETGKVDSVIGGARLGQLRPHRHRQNRTISQQRRDRSATRTASIIRKSQYRTVDGRHHQSGVKTKVLLLSATPVNNDLKDLRSQIYFVTEGRDAAFRRVRHSPASGHMTTGRNLHGMGQAPAGKDARDLMDRLSAGFSPDSMG